MPKPTKTPLRNHQRPHERQGGDDEEDEDEEDEEDEVD
jgi:hypothetical protein